MPRGYWSAILAVVGLAALSLSAIGWTALEGQNRANNSAEEGQSATPQNQVYIDQGALRNRAGLPEFAHGITDNPKPENDTERDNRDLAAQESMAAWAFWLLLFTGIGLLVTSVGTGLLLWQIILTRKAVSDTGDATKAMHEANIIAREAMGKQLRAYIGCNEIKVERFRLGQTPTFGFKIKNAGQSPALRVRCKAQLFVEMNQTPHQVRIRFEGITDLSVITVLPGQSPNVQWQFPEPLDAALYQAVIDGSAVFVYAGVVEYWDIFGKRHFSTFKNFIDRERMGTSDSISLTACSKGNYSN